VAAPNVSRGVEIELEKFPMRHHEGCSRALGSGTTCRRARVSCLQTPPRRAY